MAKWETASVKVLRKLPKENLLRRLFINANDNLLFSLFISLTMHTHTAHWEEQEIFFNLFAPMIDLLWNLSNSTLNRPGFSDGSIVDVMNILLWFFCVRKKGIFQFFKRIFCNAFSPIFFLFFVNRKRFIVFWLIFTGEKSIELRPTYVTILKYWKNSLVTQVEEWTKCTT